MRAAWLSSGRLQAAALLAAAAGTFGCEERSDTGLLVAVDAGALRLDELQFAVTEAATGRVLVDPAGKGRVEGPFDGREVRQPIYLADGLADTEVICAVAGAAAGHMLASDSHRVVLKRRELVTIAIVLADLPGGTGTGGAGGDGPGGSGGVAGGTGGSQGGGRKQLGESCGAGGECATGYCADGVCCLEACLGPCRACNFSGAPGACLIAAPGSPDPRGTCADLGAATCETNGMCDGLGACASYPAGTICAPAACKGDGMSTPLGLCDGVGSCLAGDAKRCPGGTKCNAGVCL